MPKLQSIKLTESERSQTEIRSLPSIQKEDVEQEICDQQKTPATQDLAGRKKGFG